MSGTAHDDDAAHEQKSSESSESRILNLYTERFRSFAGKNGKQPPPYSDGILTPPWHKDSRYMLRKPRYESYIDAAFRSSCTNEVFMFTGFHYFVVKYDAHKKKRMRIMSSPNPHSCSLMLFMNFMVVLDFVNVELMLLLVVTVLIKHFSFRGHGVQR
ncbi:unnamed protein product [Amaranthus hypochondriacus]